TNQSGEIDERKGDRIATRLDTSEDVLAVGRCRRFNGGSIGLLLQPDSRAGQRASCIICETALDPARRGRGLRQSAGRNQESDNDPHAQATSAAPWLDWSATRQRYHLGTLQPVSEFRPAVIVSSMFTNPGSSRATRRRFRDKPVRQCSRT